jgi:hypothetical protein
MTGIANFLFDRRAGEQGTEARHAARLRDPYW